MTDHSAFFFVHFLLWHLHPSLSISHCRFVENKRVQWAKINNSLHRLYLNNCDAKNIEYNGNNQLNLELLNLSSNRIETLPDQFLSNNPRKLILHLKNNQLNHLPDSILQNKKLTICSLDCIFMKNISKWPNIKTCKDIFEDCRSGSALVPVTVTLLLAILVLGALGLACYWKRYCYTSNFALPKFLHQKRNQNDSDLPHIPGTPSEYTGPKHFPPCQIKDKPCPLSKDNTDHSYENVDTGPVSRAEECLTDVYENIAQFNSEQHVYGNESSAEYCNFQKPHCLNTPSDEDIYVLPD